MPLIASFSSASHGRSKNNALDSEMQKYLRMKWFWTFHLNCIFYITLHFDFSWQRLSSHDKRFSSGSISNSYSGPCLLTKCCWICQLLSLSLSLSLSHFHFLFFKNWPCYRIIAGHRPTTIMKKSSLFKFSLNGLFSNFTGKALFVNTCVSSSNCH